MDTVIIAIFTACLGYFFARIQGSRNRLHIFQESISRLQAKLKDARGEELIEYFISHRSNIRDACAIQAIDTPFWKRKKFILTYEELLRLERTDLIQDTVRDEMIRRGSYAQDAPHTPYAKFPGRERIRDLLTNLDRLAG